MSIMNLITLSCVLMAVANAAEEEDMLNLRQKKDVSETFKRATPPADYRYNSGYYNGVYDNYNNNNNPYGYKGYNNPANNYPGYYNNRYYNRRSYPNNYDGRSYGPHNGGYPNYYNNNTRYPYGNYAGYQGNYPGPYQNYAGYQGYNPYFGGKNNGYNDRYYNSGYYQGGYYNPGVYNRANDVDTTKNQ